MGCGGREGGKEGRKEGGHCQMEFEKPQRKAAMLGGDVGKIPLLFGKSRVLLSLLECIRIPSRVAIKEWITVTIPATTKASRG